MVDVGEPGRPRKTLTSGFFDGAATHSPKVMSFVEFPVAVEFAFLNLLTPARAEHWGVL